MTRTLLPALLLLASCAAPIETIPGAPYPKSTFVTAIEWAPESTVVKRADGSDIWAVTWADDDALYTAYGDGWGFEPRASDKLSLGYAKITGGPDDFTAVNIRSPSGETTGGGRKGKKASGLLMVEGVLYMWVRNFDPERGGSQLAWSDDHAKTWTWADWHFPELGCPAFLNFGRNYAGARDGYVYVYSPDTPDAYDETDEAVLLRVPKERIRDRAAYEFFTGTYRDKPVWSRDFAKRRAVFAFKGGCNRMDVVFNKPLKRCFMVMRSRGKAGGISHFGIYDAPKPWGPWTTVYYEEKDWGEAKGWGESQRIPSKWIAADGKSFYLIYAGDDAFRLRKATLQTAR